MEFFSPDSALGGQFSFQVSPESLQPVNMISFFVGVFILSVFNHSVDIAPRDDTGVSSPCVRTNDRTFFKVPLSVPRGFFFAANNVRQFLHFNLPSPFFQNFVFQQLGHFILLRIIMKFYHFQVHFLNFTLNIVKFRNTIGTHILNF